MQLTRSQPKYWCKHCSTYVKDTPFERKQHENTGKHQGNLKRFLRGIQNDHEKGERDKERAKAEVDRLNKVVGGSSTSAGSSTSKPTVIRKSTTSAPTVADQKRQWAQLAEMGIEVPDNFRAEMAIPGQWQSISKPIETEPKPEDTLSVGVRKRKVEDEDGEESGGTVQRRGWGTSTRRYPGNDDPDLDALLSETVTKKETVKTEDKVDTNGIVNTNAKLSVFPHETKLEPRQPSTETASPRPDEIEGVFGGPFVKSEDVEPETKIALVDTSNIESLPVFKKRKTKSKA